MILQCIRLHQYELLNEIALVLGEKVEPTVIHLGANEPLVTVAISGSANQVEQVKE